MQETQQPHAHQVVMDRFTDACAADERVLAAFLGGSHARRAADAYSDLDLYLITTDDAYEDFFAGRAAFIRLLGEPVFVEDFAGYGFDLVFFILADGLEGELGLGRESQFAHIHGGPYRVLLDKQQVLAGAAFALHEPAQAAQVEALRHVVFSFWHDLSHFITAMGREQRWGAHGQVEALRRQCVNLARFSHNFSEPADGYEKVEQALAVERLAPLEATFCPLEREAMVQAARVIVQFYQFYRELAPLLARRHGLTYPADLERVMLARLRKLAAHGA